MLPKPLYEALPFAYFGMGMLTMGAIESPARYFPALLLAVAGFAVMYMRYNYRHSRHPTPASVKSPRGQRGRHRI
ncbi:MAG: hypothetical protein HYV16_08230 [Gammaproteobacteria bacterium]|nr:hypothetical protein [Gammaproteobacteria bacterium]